MKKIITELWFNWSPSVSDGKEIFADEYGRHKVGEKGVIKITEWAAQGEGDKWNYYVEFENGNAETIFNPNRVFYEPHTI